jgi:hypothetical protein
MGDACLLVGHAPRCKTPNRSWALRTNLAWLPAGPVAAVAWPGRHDPSCVAWRRRPVTAYVSDPTRISPLEFQTVRHSEEPCRYPRSTALWARRLAHHSPWFVCARTGPYGRRLLPSAAAGGPLTPSTPPCRRVVSHHVVASAGSVLGGRTAEAPPPAAARARRRMSVTCSASQGGRGSCATRACSCSRIWSNRLFGPCVASSTDR